MGRDVRAVLSAVIVLGCVWSTDTSAQVVHGRVENGGRGLEDAAVYLIPLNDSVHVRPDEPVVVDQIHLNFSPGVVVVTPGTEIVFLNSDDVLHNVFGPSGSGTEDGFDLGTYARDEERSQIFARPGLNVVLCHVHPEMALFVVVAPTYHRALSEADGSFRIEDVPPGTYRMHAWHPRHWRNEYSAEVFIGEDGRDVNIVLGRRPSTRP